MTDCTPDDSVLLSLHELTIRGWLEPRSSDRHIHIHAGLPSRPMGLPASACNLVETQIRQIIGILFHVRLGSSIISEEEFLREGADLIRTMMAGVGRVHADIEAASVETEMTPLSYYVALALYAKFVAAKLHEPKLIQLYDDEGIIYFRLCS